MLAAICRSTVALKTTAKIWLTGIKEKVANPYILVSPSTTIYGNAPHLVYNIYYRIHNATVRQWMTANQKP